MSGQRRGREMTRWPGLKWSWSSRDEFVQCWAPRYWHFVEREVDERYDRHIGRPYTPGDVVALFEWKNGIRLSNAKRASVERNFIARLDELHALPEDLEPGDFFRRWSKGGAIWRTFWLHLWQPMRFPIYDQHLYRGMSWIGEWESQEIPTSDKQKIRDFLELCLPFWWEHGLSSRDDDRALWTFGKVLKMGCRPVISR